MQVYKFKLNFNFNILLNGKFRIQKGRRNKK